MDEKLIKSISECAKLFSEKKYIESGYIAVRESDGIVITAQKADMSAIGENDVVFVNDKNIESFDGNFRAAAVILFCAIRQDKMSEAAAIVDSDAILSYSSKRKPLQPVTDMVAKLLGVTVKCSSKNVAAEIVTSLSGYRNACFMPDAGAVIKARSLKELLEATEVLDKACSAEVLAENKGGTQHINPFNSLIEQVVYKFTTRGTSAKNAVSADDKKEEGNTQPSENADSSDINSNQEGEADNSGSNQTVEEIAENNNDTNQEGKPCDNIIRKITLADGKVVALACPRYITAVCAIGKPMPVTEGYKEKFGEEIPCLPSKLLFGDKALEKSVELMGDAKVCFMSQHGAIVRADSEQELCETLTSLEEACKAYFEA